MFSPPWRSQSIEKLVADAFSELATEKISDAYSREDFIGKIMGRITKDRRMSRKDLIKARNLAANYADMICRGKLI